ncbi:MAG: hypothetical protein ACI87I_003125 [Pseudoalteromonas tetraodonis]|jgi:hypothetical protein|uniref:glycosyltransferase family 10 domain-containing protein n=1 Tax=Pseudoalteromonas tetraodonis TaxID=43659 RepID=UPI00398996AA
MKASLVIDYHLNNKIFDVSDRSVNRDDYAYSIWLLKQKCKSVNIELSTCDINKLSDSDMAFYFDLPKHEEKVETEIAYLFLFESEVIKLNNWEKLNHNQYSKVFTWNDELVDNKKYFKINFTHKFPESREAHRSNQKKIASKKLCTLIAGNKKVNHPLELYSEREKTIRWFEQNTNNEFDFYGIGWQKHTSSNRLLRALLSKMSFLNTLFPLSYPSYKGPVDSKKATLNNYKFAICYENAQLIPGYITEKIFDCFFAGCIPIYWGAPNVTDHIPANCFIDRRKFNSHEELYHYISNMSEVEYSVILSNIEDYLFSEQSTPYRAETFAKTIVKHVLADLK